MNNEQGNVHRICHACHNRWHAKNDPDYNWNATVYPAHAPKPQTQQEQQEALLNHLKYSSKKLPKLKD